LPAELAASLIPKRRSISDTKRVLCYYRLSPDGRRMVFGGRARFTPANPGLCAKVLHGYMTERYPQLKGARVTHSWTGTPPSPWMRCRIWGRRAGCIIAWDAMAAASR
jgi:glycine/D-amino acid oxidase-like deaminating enzyme